MPPLVLIVPFAFCPHCQTYDIALGLAYIGFKHINGALVDLSQIVDNGYLVAARNFGNNWLR